MDLIGLANRRKVIRLNDQVNELRKQIMHPDMLVKMADAHTPDYIYRIDSFTGSLSACCCSRTARGSGIG